MTARRIEASVAYATPERQLLVAVSLPAGATVGDAIIASGIVAAESIDMARARIAIFGARARLDRELADGDRVEILRPLIADPKEARRLRAKATPRVTSR